MSKSKSQVAFNDENIRKNKRRLFELECQASTSYAETLLLIADVEENRALLGRNFSAAFNGNRAIAVDNIEDLYRCRMLMVDALDAKNEVERSFKVAMTNSLRIDLLESKFTLCETLRNVATQMAEVNDLLMSLNTLIANHNEKLADQGTDMVSENAEWIDGDIGKRFSAASPETTADIVNGNAERLATLSKKSISVEEQAGLMVKNIESETKSIMQMADEIAARRARIQAEREKVIANQKRSSELMEK